MRVPVAARTWSRKMPASTDGKKLYLYGAGFEIEVYDAATLKYERTWDLNNDVTMAGMIALP